MTRIEVAFCLPSPDIEALIQGRIIVASPRCLSDQDDSLRSAHLMR
jgi:hypothetical protein